MSYRLRHPGSVIAVALDHRIAEKLGLDAGSDGKASRQRGFPVIARRVVEARSTLFREGEMAHSYFVLASGEMLATRWNKSQSRETTRTVVSGDMFIFNCDDRHMATCCATRDSVVWAIDRKWLDRAAKGNAAVTSLLQSIHADELGMFLESRLAPSGQPATSGACHPDKQNF